MSVLLHTIIWLQIPEENVEGLPPTIEIQKQTVDTTIAGAISLNLDDVSWSDQMPQTVRQSLRSVPDESLLKSSYRLWIINYDSIILYYLLYSYFRSSDSNDVTDKKKIIRKYKCPTCDKSYTQSHNLKTHRQKVHGL